MFRKSPAKNLNHINVSVVSHCPATPTDWAGLAQVTIDVLPDDLLLEIFDLYREDWTRRSSVKSNWGWTTLVHVCRRWRGTILASPQRLHLRITCSTMTPVETSLDIWPPFPIAIIYSPSHFLGHKFKDENNIIAALEH